MNRYTTKHRINLTINKEIYEKFIELSKNKAINRSKLIELYIEKWINENGK